MGFSGGQYDASIFSDTVDYTGLDPIYNFQFQSNDVTQIGAYEIRLEITTLTGVNRTNKLPLTTITFVEPCATGADLQIDMSMMTI